MVAQILGPSDRRASADRRTEVRSPASVIQFGTLKRNRSGTSPGISAYERLGEQRQLRAVLLLGDLGEPLEFRQRFVQRARGAVRCGRGLDDGALDFGHGRLRLILISDNWPVEG